jgi:hypothetical protein
MYELVKQIGLSAFATREAVPFVISIAIAEWFYKFHSFTLEALAFLATWYLISSAVGFFARRGE